MPKNKEFIPKLLPAVIEELNNRRGKWPEISEATGINYSTLQKIVQGQVINPGVNTVELLHWHLIGDPEKAA